MAHHNGQEWLNLVVCKLKQAIFLFAKGTKFHPGTNVGVGKIILFLHL